MSCLSRVNVHSFQEVQPDNIDNKWVFLKGLGRRSCFVAKSIYIHSRSQGGIFHCGFAVKLCGLEFGRQLSFGIASHFVLLLLVLLVTALSMATI